MANRPFMRRHFFLFASLLALAGGVFYYFSADTTPPVLIVSSWEKPGGSAYELWINQEPVALLAPPFRHAQMTNPLREGRNLVELKPVSSGSPPKSELEVFWGQGDDLKEVQVDGLSFAVESRVPILETHSQEFPAGFDFSTLKVIAWSYIEDYSRANAEGLAKQAGIVMEELRQGFPAWYWAGGDVSVNRPQSREDLVLVYGRRYALVYRLPGEDMDSRSLITVRNGSVAVSQKYLLFYFAADGTPKPLLSNTKAAVRF